MRQILPVRILPPPIHRHRHSRTTSDSISVDVTCPIKGIPHPFPDPKPARLDVLRPSALSDFPGDFHAASQGMAVIMFPWRQQERLTCSALKGTKSAFI